MRDAFFRGLRCIARAVAVLVLVCASTARAQLRPTLDARAIRQWAAVLATHDARSSSDTLAIDGALASRIAPLRAVAVRVVGLNRMDSRYARLHTLLLADADTAVRRDAAFAIGLATDTTGCSALRSALVRNDTGEAAAWAIGEMNGRCGEFGKTLATAHSMTTRAALLRVAGKWAPFPDSSVASAYVRARSVDERWAALYAFARSRRSAGARFAIVASRDGAAPVREVAARLMAPAIQSGADTLPIIRRLGVLLRDRAPHVRIAAARSLAGYHAAAIPAFNAAWSLERDANVRVTMAQSVGGVASDTATLWATWWTSDTTHMVRRALLASAWQSGAIAALRAASGGSIDASPDFRMRIAMIDGAASVSADRNVALILPFRSDADARVRAAVIGALSGGSDSLKAAIAWPTLRDSARRDPDVGVRAAALRSYTRAANASDLAVALDGLTRAERDRDADAREAALAIISSAWRRDSTAFADSLAQQLARLPVPADPLLRRRVTAVTPLAHWRNTPAPLPPTSEVYERIVREFVVPSLAGHAKSLSIATDRGAVRIMLDGVHAPMTADHLSRLARTDYFRGTRFHRVVPAFVAQGGDPRGDGSGGPGFAMRDELNRSRYLRGAAGMALSGPDTGGSQFFLTVAPQPHLDGHYTVFGTVTSGLAVMDALVQGDAIRTISALPQ